MRFKTKQQILQLWLKHRATNFFIEANIYTFRKREKKITAPLAFYVFGLFGFYFYFNSGFDFFLFSFTLRFYLILFSLILFYWYLPHPFALLQNYCDNTLNHDNGAISILLRDLIFNRNNRIEKMPQHKNTTHTHT